MTRNSSGMPQGHSQSNGSDWGAYAMMVLKQLEDHDAAMEKLQDRVRILEQRIEVLEMKIYVYVALIAGVITVVGGAAVNYILTHLK